MSKPGTPAGAEPTILLGGGPGEPVIDNFVGVLAQIDRLGDSDPPATAADRARLNDALGAIDAWRASAAHRPLVVLDQRGAGYSEPSLDCADPDPASCRTALEGRGIDLTAYTTSANADDVDAVRAALGAERVTLDGGSYGTRLGLEVIRRHGDRIRAAVLDGVAPPQIPILSDTVRRYDESLAVLFDLCRADPACDTSYPGLRRTFYATVALRDREPLTVPANEVFPGGRLTGQNLRGLVWEGLFDRDPVPWLPRLVIAFADGDADFIATYLGKPNPIATGGLSEGMSWSMECSGSTGTDTRATIAHAAAGLHPAIRDAVANQYAGTLGICDAWGVRAIDPGAGEPVASDRPVLLLSGQLDPGTPPEYADVAARTLTHATSVVLPAQGHTDGMFTACGVRLRTTFLDDPAAPLDLSCTAATPPISFAEPGT